MTKCALAAILLAASCAVFGGETMTRVPVLIELFTSEGCSSCPPADRVLAELDRDQPVRGVELIVLSEHVDYWNYLGWKDRFSSSQLTARQGEYARQFQLRSIYTPQIVVDGVAELIGSSKSGATKAAAEAARRDKLPLVVDAGKARTQGKVEVRVSLAKTDGKQEPGRLFVALAENRAASDVKRGENGGRMLEHVAVVRQIQDVGEVRSADGFTKDVTMTIPADAGSSGLRVVAFLQSPSGRILGVAMKIL